ncbi:MAG: amidohydrolase family protein [Deltaproteobacteria bacterium]|jgi:predicted TIM-barrel fold metal-dependent hydrolase|nr:amidohydrolase family protein [Deltaproteobacteria bacterium]MBW2495838.1 amidohydrolase family protein [Deltaproteobacteria bacterium]
MATRSQQIKNRLGHPVVDCDGHLVEVVPHYLEHLARVGGTDMAQRFREGLLSGRDWLGGQASERARRETRRIRNGWWTMPTANTLDSATPLLPRLLDERLDRFGIDFTILYPGLGLMLPAQSVDELRRASVRALNAYLAETWGPYSARMTPAAVIPMHTPAEALQELDYAIGELGLKAISIPPGVWRPIPAVETRAPGSFPEAGWLDCYGLDSEYDYDPVWQRCQELGVAVTSHGGTVPNLPWHGRSTTNYVYNHVGTHAHQQSLLCKALFLGGVMQRFPTLHFGFLECGVGWAINQYADLIGHWEKRGAKGLDNLDPAKLDREQFLALFARYGDRPVEGEPHEISIGLLDARDGLEAHDDFAALGIERAEDFRDRFTRTLFFGCEADDPITAWAFDEKRNPFGARLRAVFSSDIGHWDVIEMERVLEEAWEGVEEGLLTEADLRAFTFEHPVALHGRANPRFFEGTSVETAAREWLAG